MTDIKIKTKTHATDNELACFLSKSLSANEMRRVETHIASCRQCLDKVASAHEAVSAFRPGRRSKNERKNIMKKINMYLVLAIVTFALSFVTPKYFIQLLVATVILGIKWVVDSKSAKMLVMIYEAWKSGGEKEASRMLETLNAGPKRRF